jgi:hypothetical protein
MKQGKILKKTPAAANNSCSNEENDSATSNDDSDYEKDSDYLVKKCFKNLVEESLRKFLHDYEFIQGNENAASSHGSDLETPAKAASNRVRLSTKFYRIKLYHDCMHRKRSSNLLSQNQVPIDFASVTIVAMNTCNLIEAS